MINPTHLQATPNDVRLIWCILGDTIPIVFDREPNAEEQAGLRARPCTLGGTYRRTVRCRVNGDGYWYERQWLLCDGEVVGSVVLPETGGDL